MTRESLQPPGGADGEGPERPLDSVPVEDPWEEIIPGRVWQSSGRPSAAPRRVALWALILEARGVPFEVLDREGRPHIFVPAERLSQAVAELRLYERENRGWPPEPPPVDLADNTLITMSALLLLAIFFNLTRWNGAILGHASIDWVGLGNADAGKILGGQWWRLITALTLHAGWLHLLGNLVIGGVFIIRLCRELGSGLGWSLVILSGALGNLVNAWFQDFRHESIGLSTAIFGVVGILAALNLLRSRGRFSARWLAPLAGGVALLGLLGSGGANTDLGAHLFGFLGGLALGVATGLGLRLYGRPGPRVNALLSLAAFLTPLLAWLAALSSAGQL